MRSLTLQDALELKDAHALRLTPEAVIRHFSHRFLE